MALEKSALEIKHLTKSYGKARGIVDVSLSVAEGEIFGFLGPNGAGKSTTINTILDLLRPNAGTVKILGIDHKKSVLARQKIGFLSGDMETDPSLNGWQYLTFAAHLRGVKPSLIKPLAERLRCELDTKIKHLSRGNKQKIGLVAALMHQPDLLILDEPTSGLDPLIQAEFNKILHEHRSMGKSAFISSHVLSEVQNICDRVGFIKDGQLLKITDLKTLGAGAPRRVIARFAKQKPPERTLLALPGLTNLTHHDHTVSFNFNGDVNLLLRFLAGKNLVDIQILEPDLEDIFMSYYKGGKT